MIPDALKRIYPNPVQRLDGTPVVIFRDHRWTIPVIRLASDAELLTPPVNVVIFDRHRDSLAPGESRSFLDRFRNGGSLEELVELTAMHLSPRDDDWLLSGMEAGLISDAVRFGTEPDGMEAVTRYADSRGDAHRVFHLGRPSTELAYKGALADPGHPAAAAGLWEALGWNPATRSVVPGRNGMLLDIDLDFFTISWETYTIPFPHEVYEGEFLAPRQSPWYDDYSPADFLGTLVRAAAAVTVATEPDFCGGESGSRIILRDADRLLFGNGLHAGRLLVDYPAVYPNC